MNKKLIRWTIGPVSKAGFCSLRHSIVNLREIYNLNPKEMIVCHNQLSTQQVSFLEELEVPLYCQKETDYAIKPMGVSWKLYPPRLNPEGHELFIDNDLIIKEKINEIDEFFQSDKTLVLEDTQRAYGQFNNHILKDLIINSGLFGMPPYFDIRKYMNYYLTEWKENSGQGHEQSKTWDEQGLIALALTQRQFIKISKDIITKCDEEYIPGKGMHFIKLNRKPYHEPFANFLQTIMKL